MFSGIITPIVSPCTSDDVFDGAALETNAARLLDSGIRGLYICGGTGDAARLHAAERKTIAETLVPLTAAAGKCSIVHVGQTHLREAISLAEHAAGLGADAIASVPPRGSWNEVLDYYRALAEVGPPVIVYYMPALGTTASHDQLSELLAVKGVAGIKMSDWNLFLLNRLRAENPDKVVFTGYDEILTYGLLAGADGSIGTWSNLLPSMYSDVYSAVAEGRADDALAIQDQFAEFLAIGWKYGIIETFSELMSASGFATRCFRRPDAWSPGMIPTPVVDELLLRIEALDGIASTPA